MTTKKLGRRNFLKLSGLLTGAVLMIEAQKYFNLDPEIKFLNSLIRGTRKGQILASYDDGRTWKKLMDFGGHCCITHMANVKDILFADVAVAGHQFTVRSSDGIKWVTT